MSLCMAAVISAAEGTRALMGLQGPEWGKGQIDQSHAHSFSHLSTPPDKAVQLDCSSVMAVSPLYVTPRAKTISPLGRMSSCHSVPQQCYPLTIPKPLPKPSPLTLLCPALASYFHPGAVAQMTQRSRPSGRLDILYCTTCLLVVLVTAWTAFLRQNGEILSVVLISAILISLLSAIGGCFSMKKEREATNHNQVFLQWNLNAIMQSLIYTHC